MAIEINYLYRKSGRPYCGARVPIANEIVNSGSDGRIDCFKPAKIEFVDDVEKGIGNIFVDGNCSSVHGRLFLDDGSIKKISLSGPIVLDKGQILQLYDNFWCIDLRLGQDVQMDRLITES